MLLLGVPADGCLWLPFEVVGAVAVPVSVLCLDCLEGPGENDSVRPGALVFVDEARASGGGATVRSTVVIEEEQGIGRGISAPCVALVLVPWVGIGLDCWVLSGDSDTGWLLSPIEESINVDCVGVAGEAARGSVSEELMGSVWCRG